VRWRTAALGVAWLCAAGWGIYYLVVLGRTNEIYIAAAVLHFIIGYAWARAMMQPQYTMVFALIAIFLSGAYTRLAIGLGTNELYFAWAGPLAAIALADRSTLRTLTYSVAAFTLGIIAFLWLNP
jgi:hypothetical protein